MAEQIPIAVPVIFIGIFASGIGVYIPLRDVPIMVEKRTHKMNAKIMKL